MPQHCVYSMDSLNSHNKFIVLIVPDFYVKASFMLKLRRENMRPLFEVNYVFTAEVIPYREEWNRVTKVEARIMILPPWHSTAAIHYV